MRFWFSGPRILGGLVRPGVSFGPEDLRARKLSATQLEHARKAVRQQATARGMEVATGRCDRRVDRGRGRSAKAPHGSVDCMGNRRNDRRRAARNYSDRRVLDRRDAITTNTLVYSACWKFHSLDNGV